MKGNCIFICLYYVYINCVTNILTYDYVIERLNQAHWCIYHLPFYNLFLCLRQKCHWEETLKEGVGALAPLLLFASWLLLGEQL